MDVRERFHPVAMDADTEYPLTGIHMGGFLAKTNGTITVTEVDGTVLVDAVPVTAGIYTPIPCTFQNTGAVVTLAGGASGTLFI